MDAILKGIKRVSRQMLPEYGSFIDCLLIVDSSPLIAIDYLEISEGFAPALDVVRLT
jgi:hypothetical protein